MDAKKLVHSLNVLGSISLAFAVPWIVWKVCRAVMLKKNYNGLVRKVVVITGASSGLGEALAHEFYKCGCLVVLCARRRQELERVRADLLKTHSTIPTIPPIIHPLDLSEINSLPGHIEKILTITETIDILINNGGVSHRGSVISTKPDVDIKIMLVNYFGAAALTKAILPHMVRNKTGQIVLIGSVQGLVAVPERSAYSASKHALQAFSDSLRAEVASHNIDVTMISPGYIRTDLSRNALTATGARYNEMDPATENGYPPEYVAKAIVKAVVQKKKELVIATLLPNMAIFLRKYLPAFYFYVMAKRAQKQSSI